MVAFLLDYLEWREEMCVVDLAPECTAGIRLLTFTTVNI